jgi:hypothetical protein
MLRFTTNSPHSAPLGRRDSRRIGTLGLGGLTLADQLTLQGTLSAAGSVARDKSVICLFMHGGTPRFETFDPKMDAPSEIRSVTDEIPTSIPGITFGGTFPKLARLAVKFSIVRSFVTGDNVNDLKSIAGKHTLNANHGSL